MADASKEALAALRFLPGLVIPEGRLAGKPLKLAKYQKDFVRGAFAQGIEAGCLSIGRGNAKYEILRNYAFVRLRYSASATSKMAWCVWSVSAACILKRL